MTLEAFLAGFTLPHIAVGTVALLSFWCAALSRKGCRFHRHAGRVYLLAMVGVIVTAIPLSAVLFLRGAPVMGIFMAYLVILVAFNCRNAWRAVTFRREFARYASRSMQVSAWLTALAGLVVVASGIAHHAPILIAFGAVGPITAWQALKLVRKGPARPNWWLTEHFGAMIGNGVATHIAFLQVGLINALPGLDLAVVRNLGWFGPLLVAVVAGVWLSRRYGRGAESSSRPNLSNRPWSSGSSSSSP